MKTEALERYKEIAENIYRKYPNISDKGLSFYLLKDLQKAGFNPNQPRNEDGTWGGGGQSEFNDIEYGKPEWQNCLNMYAKNPTNIAHHSRTGGEAWVRRPLDCIKHGLTQIKPYKGVSYRGIAVDPDIYSDILDDVEKGEMVFPGLTSSSIKKEVAFIYGTEQRFHRGGHRILFILDGKTGRDISPYVNINQTWEKEVLFDQNTKWEVIKTEDSNDGLFEYLSIFLKEKSKKSLKAWFDPNQQRYSSGRWGSNSWHKIDIKEQVKAHYKDPNNQGSTFDPRTGKNMAYAKGMYSVGVFNESDGISKNLPGNVTFDSLNNFIENNKDTLTLPDNKYLIGTWFDTGKDKTGLWLDIVELVDNLEEATALGLKHNQIDIWDLEKMKPVPIGGTGKYLVTVMEAKGNNKRKPDWAGFGRIIQRNNPKLMEEALKRGKEKPKK